MVGDDRRVSSVEQLNVKIAISEFIKKWIDCETYSMMFVKKYWYGGCMYNGYLVQCTHRISEQSNTEGYYHGRHFFDRYRTVLSWHGLPGPAKSKTQDSSYPVTPASTRTICCSARVFF